jgi:hypothetical protein
MLGLLFVGFSLRLKGPLMLQISLVTFQSLGSLDFLTFKVKSAIHIFFKSSALII